MFCKILILEKNFSIFLIFFAIFQFFNICSHCSDFLASRLKKAPLGVSSLRAEFPLGFDFMLLQFVDVVECSSRF